MIRFNKEEELKLYVNGKCEMEIYIDEDIDWLQLERPVDLESDEPLDDNQVHGMSLSLECYGIKKLDGKYILPHDCTAMLADTRYRFLWILYYSNIHIPNEELEQFRGLILELFYKFNEKKWC